MNLKQNLMKAWAKIRKWPWCPIGLTALCLFWMCRFFYLAFIAWGYGYMTDYYDCEPPYDLETLNKLIMQGLICGLFYLALFLYFLRETIKFFKQK